MNHPRFLAEHNCTGLFAQGNHVERYGGGEFSAPRAWVFAQLLWDPYQDGHVLVYDFVDYVHGPAAPFLDQYIQLAQEAVQAKEMQFSIFVDSSQLAYLTPEFVAQAEALFRKAEAAAQMDEGLYHHGGT